MTRPIFFILLTLATPLKFSNAEELRNYYIGVFGGGVKTQLLNSHSSERAGLGVEIGKNLSERFILSFLYMGSPYKAGTNIGLISPSVDWKLTQFLSVGALLGYGWRSKRQNGKEYEVLYSPSAGLRAGLHSILSDQLSMGLMGMGFIMGPKSRGEISFDPSQNLALLLSLNFWFDARANMEKH